MARAHLFKRPMSSADAAHFETDLLAEVVPNPAVSPDAVKTTRCLTSGCRNALPRHAKFCCACGAANPDYCEEALRASRVSQWPRSVLRRLRVRRSLKERLCFLWHVCRRGWRDALACARAGSPCQSRTQGLRLRLLLLLQRASSPHGMYCLADLLAE